MSYDTITDTPYVVTFTSHHTEVYNIKTGETTKVDAVFNNVYQPEIRNGILGILSKGNTRLFDLNAEGGASEIFCYTATDPIGE